MGGQDSGGVRLAPGGATLRSRDAESRELVPEPGHLRGCGLLISHAADGASGRGELQVLDAVVRGSRGLASRS